MRVIDQLQANIKLKEGLPIIFPTDTLPAVACLPEFSEIIYKVKKRDINKPLILMASEITQILEFVDNVAIDDVNKIAIKYWPGPLTIVVPLSKKKKFKFISISIDYPVSI